MTATEAQAAVDYRRRARRSPSAIGRGLEGLELEGPPGSDGRPPVTHVDALPDGGKRVVEGAAAKLDRPEAMTGSERIALEAIIIPDHRPAIAIRQGSYTVTHSSHFSAATRRCPSSSRRSLTRTSCTWGDRSCRCLLRQGWIGWT
ncbi:hypothetical protein [Sphingomonas abietis]|uniref:Uncharacterized protein n=1 Tax=Sphingomonas abietis TaxID=3012344 RepID=A0ABY7NQK2_9SPHN|nr:hypothetical protein [Sphingomonas abietis]WBO23817.1 hypothetical protein PBT88_06765 [Sphingomonas abietis]